MKGETKKATVIATGKTVEVYKLKRGPWCNAVDFQTEYDEKELKFIKPTQ